MSGKCLIGHGIRSKVVIFKVLLGKTCDMSTEWIFHAESTGDSPVADRPFGAELDPQKHPKQAPNRV